MTVDMAKLEEGLGKLSGLDLEAAEVMERSEGNTFPDVTFSKSFHAKLAAIALGVAAADIKELPLKEYMRVAQAVFSFLYGNSGETKTRLTKSEA